MFTISRKKHLKASHPALYSNICTNLGLLYANKFNDEHRGIPLLEEGLSVAGTSEQVSHSLRAFAKVYGRVTFFADAVERYDKAIGFYRQLIRQAEQQDRPDQVSLAQYHLSLADVQAPYRSLIVSHVNSGKPFADACTSYDRALVLFRNVLGATHEFLMPAHNNLGFSLVQRHEVSENLQHLIHHLDLEGTTFCPLPPPFY